MKPKIEYPKYEVNGRIMRDYEDANLYWKIHGGILMQKIDSVTPWHVLQSDHPMS